MLRIMVVGAFLWALILLPFLAFAQGDGTNLPSGCDTRIGNYRCEAFYLCDGKTSASTDCSEFDLQRADWGYPTKFVVTPLVETSCSATPKLTVNGRHVSAGLAIPLDSVPIETGVRPSQTFLPDYRYVYPTLSEMADCTVYDAAIVLYWEVH